MIANRPDLASFPLKLSALTPFTVGSGRTLGRADYMLQVNPRSGSPLIRVLDVERFIAESPLPPEKKLEMIEKRTGLERFSRYVLACSFRQARDGLELVEFHRDSRGLPLVPASSLRGLLRTALVYQLASVGPNGPAIVRDGVAAAMEGRWRREGAAQRLERALLGRREEDPLRAVRIGEPAPASNEDVRAYELQVLSLAGGRPSPKTTIYVEALDPRTTAPYEYEVQVDRSALRQADGSPHRAASHLQGKTELLASLRAFAAALLEAERRYYFESGARDLSRLLDETARRAEGRVALPFGFGAGWRSKTLGLLLGPAELQRLAPLLSPGRTYYRLAGRPLFPKTRRWIGEGGRPSQPFGWVAIE